MLMRTGVDINRTSLFIVEKCKWGLHNEESNQQKVTCLMTGIVTVRIAIS